MATDVEVGGGQVSKFEQRLRKTRALQEKSQTPAEVTVPAPEVRSFTRQEFEEMRRERLLRAPGVLPYRADDLVDGVPVRDLIRGSAENRPDKGNKPRTFLEYVKAMAKKKGLDEARIPEVDDEGMAVLEGEEARKAFLEVVNGALETLATHGIFQGGRLQKFSDLDGKACIALFKMAGINVSESGARSRSKGGVALTYVEPGAAVEGGINVDTSGKEGVVFDPETGTLYMDHHGGESRSDTSAAELVYDTLWRCGLIEPTMELEAAVAFVTAKDNGMMLEYGLQEMGLENNREEMRRMFMQSGRTLAGLSDFVQFEELLKMYQSWVKDPESVWGMCFDSPYRVMTDEELKQIGFRGKGKTLFDRAVERDRAVQQSAETVLRLNEEGWAFNSEKYGRVLVDNKRQVGLGAEAALALGFDTYVIWNKEENSFVIQSTRDLEIELPQGIKVRDRMWLKKRDDEPLTVTLGDLTASLGLKPDEVGTGLGGALEAEKAPDVVELNLDELMGLDSGEAKDAGATELDLDSLMEEPVGPMPGADREIELAEAPALEVREEEDDELARAVAEVLAAPVETDEELKARQERERAWEEELLEAQRRKEKEETRLSFSNLFKPTFWKKNWGKVRGWFSKTFGF